MFDAYYVRGGTHLVWTELAGWLDTHGAGAADPRTARDGHNTVAGLKILGKYLRTA
jgi:hypothetical protein